MAARIDLYLDGLRIIESTNRLTGIGHAVAEVSTAERVCPSPVQDNHEVSLILVGRKMVVLLGQLLGDEPGNLRKILFSLRLVPYHAIHPASVTDGIILTFISATIFKLTFVVVGHLGVDGNRDWFIISRGNQGG